MNREVTREVSGNRIIQIYELIFGTWRLGIGPKDTGYYDDEW